ncbi:MAG: sulfite oxidase [Gammaproteobacteria bacterium]|nr:sulfite oxidase [Gammaproteobacteria bacterium]MCY3687660.1 sulfite oxidase [Gammaproteobacteria bacterium]MDE0479360.1 sulfite oxidase [Gammaproteobacteria bacterium]MXY91744.1 sulfite oxidase [Gammaproteobacteria bacterium]MYG95504.1 sulfite oxidase [Gammaproteobacteria bacterium]
MIRNRISLTEALRRDPVAADRLLWGRESDPLTRRGFIRKGGLLAMGAALGSAIPYARFMPAGLVPAAFAQEDAPGEIPGKEGLIVLNDRPLNAETPAHLLDDSVTPNRYMFIRNNGTVPENIDPETWELEVGGESCLRPDRFSIADLRARFETVTLQLQLECGGNGRSEFVPAASGNQWTTGAIGCPSFTGVRLRDVLNYCGVGADAVYVGYHGADIHPSGDPDLDAISRGVTIEKALERESLIAWQMNGEDIPLQNGFPLRLVCGGWPGSVSGKWLNRLVVRNRVHDGEKMASPSYMVPHLPVAPGSRVPDSDMRIIESMPVKSLITYPRSGITIGQRERLDVRGHAWAGDETVSAVFLSTDFGATWLPTAVQSPANRLSWQDWASWVQFTEPGYYEIWARAMDASGRSQPMVVPGWNPRGYLNNACHRIAVQVT